MIVQRGVAVAWLQTASAGQTLVYARATFLPVKSEVARMLREAAEAGHVVLYRERREHGQGEENFRYIAKRTAKALPGAGKADCGAGKGPNRRVTPMRDLAREIAPHVRSMLADGASRSPSRIARSLGVYSHNVVVAALRMIDGERLAA